MKPPPPPSQAPAQRSKRFSESELLHALSQYAKEQGVTVAEEELDKAFEKYSQQKKFEEEMKSLHLSKEQAKEQLRTILLTQKLKEKITVTAQEIAAFRKKTGSKKPTQAIENELKEQKLYAALVPYLKRE